MSESSFVTFCKYWVWAGIPATAVGLALLILSIRGVVLTVRKAHLFKVPVAEKQEIVFAEAGPVVLSIEGPRFSGRFAHIAFELRGINGDPVGGHRTLFHARTSGISTARMEVLTYDIPRPGSYVLNMSGSGVPQAGDPTDAVVFMKPHLGRSMAYVIGIVLASGVFIASLILFLLSLYEPNAASRGIWESSAMARTQGNSGRKAVVIIRR